MVPEIGYDAIFTRFGDGKMDKTLKIQRFVEVLDDLDRLSDNAIVERKDISEFKGNDPLAEKLLKAYDERLKVASEKAFDLFDVNHQNLIPTLDLERVLCCVGRRLHNDDMQVSNFIYGSIKLNN